MRATSRKLISLTRTLLECRQTWSKQRSAMSSKQAPQSRISPRAAVRLPAGLSRAEREITEKSRRSL